MEKKKLEKLFFSDNCIWRCCYKLSLLRREYLLSALNGLRKSPNILHITKRDFFWLNFFHRNQWISLRCCRSDFTSVSDRLPCYLSKGPLKRDFLDLYLTTFSEVRKFVNTQAMTVIFVFQMFKIESTFRKSKKKLRNPFFWP